MRNEKCSDCGEMFTIELAELIYKLDNGMRLPKRCPHCRRKNRSASNPYEGLCRVMTAYPATKGHRRQVHGGVEIN